MNCWTFLSPLVGYAGLKWSVLCLSSISWLYAQFYGFSVGVFPCNFDVILRVNNFTVVIIWKKEFIVSCVTIQNNWLPVLSVKIQIVSVSWSTMFTILSCVYYDQIDIVILILLLLNYCLVLFLNKTKDHCFCMFLEKSNVTVEVMLYLMN